MCLSSEIDLSLEQRLDRSIGRIHHNLDVHARVLAVKRLQERLVALYGTSATLNYGARADGTYESLLVLPRRSAKPLVSDDGP